MSSPVVEAIKKFNEMLKKDEAGNLLKKAIRNVAFDAEHEEKETSEKYQKYADELDAYGAPRALVNAFEKMAKEEMEHHFLFMKLIYGIK